MVLERNLFLGQLLSISLRRIQSKQNFDKKRDKENTRAVIGNTPSRAVNPRQKVRKKMKCKNKEIHVLGTEYNDKTETIKVKDLRCIVTNDDRGKTLSVDNGSIQFTIPFEPLEKYLTN